MPRKILKQHIAVFGESGSGKTVLISSFYGLMRDKNTQERTHLDVVADDAGQGSRLMQNYLGMSRKGQAPAGNRFSAIPYSFTANLDPNGADAYKGIRLVWHDYPGEWFHETPSGPEEEQRRADTFQLLLESDVAIILVDGEELSRNAGHEEQYLKVLFTNIRNGLLPVVQKLEESGKRLARFPRIWMFALSKSDIVPDMSVQAFQELVVLNAADEVDQLRLLLKRVVLDTEALSVGEDFVLLSSAKFVPGKIEVAERVGLDLIMPIATVLPLKRFIRWAEARNFRGRVAEVLVGRASAVAAVVGILVGFLSRGARLPGQLGLIFALISTVVSKEMIDEWVKLSGESLREANADALRKSEYLRAALTQFSIDLDEGERREILLRSPR